MDEKTREQIIIEDILLITHELHAREVSMNCVNSKFSGKGWIDLCNDAIDLFEQLKI